MSNLPTIIITDINEDNFAKVETLLFKQGFSYMGNSEHKEFNYTIEVIYGEYSDEGKKIIYSSNITYEEMYKDKDILTISAKTGNLTMFKNNLLTNNKKLLS